MNDFLKRSVPMWLALVLGMGLAIVSFYSFLQMMFFGTLVGAIENHDIGSPAPVSPVLNDYLLCHEPMLYFPRVIYQRMLGICR